MGHGNFAIIAGPCSVESEDQIISVAKASRPPEPPCSGRRVQAPHLPYDFQGLKADGIELLLEAKRETGLPIVTEIMNANHLPLFEDVDVIQVGARNMQNFELLKELGKTRKPIPPQAWAGQHHQGAADERRVHHGQRQRKRHPVRARDPHL